MRSCVVGLLLVGLVVGCTKRNPEYCEADLPCPDGRFCDLSRNKCIDDPGDGGVPPACFDAGNCPAGTPICNEGICVECRSEDDCSDPLEPICELPAGACRMCLGETECSFSPDTPHCAADGRCVECLDNGQCDVTTPVCDLPSGVCRPCGEDSECSELCDDGTGQCLPETGVIYVDAAVALSGPDCTKAAPCKTITEGLGRVTATRKHIKIAAGTYAESLIINNVTVILAGTGTASILPSAFTDQPGALVSGTSAVSMRGLEIRGAMGNSQADGVRCTGGSLALREMTIRSNAAQGVDASNCTLTVERSRVAGNLGGGIRLISADFTVLNSFIVANGSTVGGGSPLGGLQLDAPPSGPGGARFEFNTVADNVANAVVAAGLICPVTTAIAMTSSIVYANGAGVEVSGLCTWTYSDIGDTPTPTGMGNINADPQFVDIVAGDYHVMSTSPCVDAADPAATLTVDYDGDQRPAGGGFDMGADEAQ